MLSYAFEYLTVWFSLPVLAGRPHLTRSFLVITIRIQISISSVPACVELSTYAEAVEIHFSELSCEGAAREMCLFRWAQKLLAMQP